MAIKKEWHCEECALDFESAIPLCKKCGKEARRDFRTPVGISLRGNSKRIDALLERNFEKRGISNFSNRDGQPKITWDAPREFPRAFPEGDWRAGGWGKEQLLKVNQTFGSNFVAPLLHGPKVAEIQVPPDRESPKAPAPAPWQKSVKTEIIGR